MNINLKEQKARVLELALILNDIDSVTCFFSGVDPEYAKEESERLIEKYAERVTDFIKLTTKNVSVIGDLKIN